MVETGIMELEEDCFVPGMTFQGIRTPSWVSRSRNSVMVGV